MTTITISCHSLARRVLAIAIVNSQIGDWTAYVDAIPGVNQDKEWEAVVREGNKLPEAVAKILFPEIARNFRWRG